LFVWTPTATAAWNKVPGLHPAGAVKVSVNPHVPFGGNAWPVQESDETAKFESPLRNKLSVFDVSVVLRL
jgi:hypothetical protein